jgi:4-hydroxy-3-methylbut-2-enyl diphosphate reductase
MVSLKKISNLSLEIHIDPNAGFCFGVRKAIQMAEVELENSGHLYCLGQVVHNEEEENRLKQMGLKVINQEEYKNLKNTRVLIRAHGEPPETYMVARENNLTLIDGTCPIVLKLQNKIKHALEECWETNGQVLVFGKKNHPEVVGLAGQGSDKVIVIENDRDIEKIDFDKPLSIYAQTTKSKGEFNAFVQKVEDKYRNLHPNREDAVKVTDSICKHVSNRNEGLTAFAMNHDVIIFVGGEHSSNGKQLFGICKAVNDRSWYIRNPGMLKAEWFAAAKTVGVSGATSTPQWLLKDVAKAIESGKPAIGNR